jgi:fluoride ion exporter CrcB/FEX
MVVMNNDADWGRDPTARESVFAILTGIIFLGALSTLDWFLKDSLTLAAYSMFAITAVAIFVCIYMVVMHLDEARHTARRITNVS